MKRWTGWLGLTFITIGCTGIEPQLDLPKIELQHPVGYPRLIKIAPECTTVKTENYASCEVASQMLESATTQISTHRFLLHWEQTAFRDDSNPTVTAAMQRIVVPVLKQLYQASQDEYSKTMLQEVDRIQLTSRNSYDSFRRFHQCLIEQKKPSECRKR